MIRPVAGNRAAFLAGFFLLANPLAGKLVALARTDAVFTGTVTLTAALAFAAWQRGERAGPLWLAAWFSAALATLTKGPLGLVLGFAGLLAWIPDRRTPGPHPAHRAHLVGLLLWTAICGGWFLLAWRESGDALIRKMIHSELVGHALHREGPPPGVGLVVVPAYLLGRFAPWSLLTAWGLWNAFRRPEPLGPGRALQRFAAAWLLVGLLILGLASHQRGDLVAPLIPAAAVLAAFPAERLLRHWTSRRLLTAAAVLALVLGTGLELQRTNRRREVFAETRGMATLARQFVNAGGNPATLAHADTPFALQWNLRTMHRALDWPDAARHLQSPGAPGLSVTAAGLPQLLTALGTNAPTPTLRTLAQWPEEGAGRVLILRLEEHNP
jgi:4-amino-4-deoxy-L-arabinose transferase-like glycosyltransferase